MLEFMDYVQHTFFAATGWNRDNSYGALDVTARALLDFPTPTTLSLSLSSLSTAHLGTSYSLNPLGLLNGSLSYLYSSIPLSIPHRSSHIPLRLLIPGYCQSHELRRPDDSWWWEIWQRGKRLERKDTLLYGRLYLPTSDLEALYLRRLSPATQVKVKWVSGQGIRSGGTILVLLQQDRAKYSTEYLYSTDSALLGVRGLYNFGPGPRAEAGSSAAAEGDVAKQEGPGRYGRFSAGAELYYGILNKSGGMSTGFRFATLPQHDGFPYTMTLTLNPLVGNLTSTYAVKAGKLLALCSKFDFNVYSYESGFQVGMELWQRKQRDDSLDWAHSILRLPGKAGWGEPALAALERSAAAQLDAGEVRSERGLEESLVGFENEATAGVLKARLNQDGEIGVLWEGKLKELLYSFGVHVDFRKRERIFRGVGLEIQYSS